MKTYFYFVLMGLLLLFKVSYSQNDCWSLEKFPRLDMQLLLDSVKGQKEMDNYDAAIDKYYESMLNCRMPKIDTLTLDGDSISNKSLMGKVVVINFWFIGCHPCEEEIPYLDSIQQHFKGKDVEFIAITYNDKKDVKRFIKEKKFNYKMIVEGRKYCYNFMLRGYPETYIFDKENRFKGMYYGIRFVGDQEDIENKIKELL